MGAVLYNFKGSLKSQGVLIFNYYQGWQGPIFQNNGSCLPQLQQTQF